jgi:hypothetical protein
MLLILMALTVFSHGSMIRQNVFVTDMSKVSILRSYSMNRFNGFVCPLSSKTKVFEGK